MDAVRFQSSDDLMPVSIALADEGHIDSFFRIIWSMDFRVRPFREIDGNRSLHAIFSYSIFGACPADIKEAADISLAHGMAASDFAHKMFFVIQAEINHGNTEAL
jgi:hypothetical protein